MALLHDGKNLQRAMQVWHLSCVFQALLGGVAKCLARPGGSAERGQAKCVKPDTFLEL